MGPTRKPRYIDGVTMGADINGSALFIPSHKLLSFQAKWTGTAPVGPFVFQVSEDGLDPTKKETPLPSGIIGWTSLTLPSDWAAFFPGGASDAGEFVMPFVDMPSTWIRMLYDRTSGTGTLRVSVTMKD